MRRGLLIAVALGLGLGLGAGRAHADGPQVDVAPPGSIDLGQPQQIQWKVTTNAPSGDGGNHLGIAWHRTPVPASGLDTVVVLRREVGDAEPAQRGALSIAPSTVLGPILSAEFVARGGTPGEPWNALKQPMPVGSQVGVWTVVAVEKGDPAAPIEAEVEHGKRYQFALLQAVPAAQPDTYAVFYGQAIVTAPRAPVAAWFNPKRWAYLALIAITGLALAVYSVLAKRKDANLFVRRIAGVDALEDSVGRSTEMGRPVLYVTGVEETQDIQTIAGLLILGHVAKITAEYDTELKVANAYPLTMVIAEEVVRQGYAKAGRPDAHRPENVMFITPEQFAFAAGVNGMILRDRPATNIYFGRFYAESLMLAETGHLTGAVQIAGTCELTQMPFFIAACDYTLLGEELYATSAYLTREPTQLAQLKAGDVMKIVIAALVVGGVTWSTLGALGVKPCSEYNLMEKIFQ